MTRSEGRRLDVLLPHIARAMEIRRPFALTESLIQAANPTLSQTIIDQGLADLELHVSPGVELPSFAPQFPQSAPPTPAPILGFLGQIALALSVAIGGGLFLTAKRV